VDRAASEFVFEATGSAIVRSKHVQSLWGGYGELSRIELSSGESAILKDVRPPAHGDDARSHARKCRSYDVECAFYRDYASRTDDACRVPRPIAVRATAGRWLLLLEDLDAAGFPGRRSGRHARDLGACIDWLAAFHARFVGERPVGLWESGTYWHLATRPDELARTSDRELREAAPLFDRALAGARFQTIVHGDAKPANFCFAPDGRVAAVDFQYVGGGCGMKDVAYLLHGSVDADEESALLDRYFAKLGHPSLEREWRPLHRVACADFVRFLAGWSPGSYERDSRARAIVREATRNLLDTDRTAF
jgi:hypothetical protein